MSSQPESQEKDIGNCKKQECRCPPGPSHKKKTSEIAKSKNSDVLLSEITRKRHRNLRKQPMPMSSPRRCCQASRRYCQAAPRCCQATPHPAAVQQWPRPSGPTPRRRPSRHHCATEYSAWKYPRRSISSSKVPVSSIRPPRSTRIPS